jgi:hypothetical protein
MTFERIGEGYQLAVPAKGVVLEISRLRRERFDLVGELAVSCNILGAKASGEGYISLANFNLSNARARTERARTLSERSRAKGIDWETLIEDLCQRAIVAEREGTPTIVLSDLPAPEPDQEFSFEGFTFPREHPSILFADGGTAKSLFALLLGGQLAQQGLTVGFFDWELDAWTHRRRLESLFGAFMPAIRYLRCDRPLIYEVDRLAQAIRRDGIDFAFYDSIGFACDGPPEAAESALNYFRGVRQLGIGSLHIAHTTKSTETGEHRPFGSAFFHNSARCTWFGKVAGTPVSGNALTIGLFNRKANLGPQRPPIGFEVNFDRNRTTFTKVDVRDVGELAASLPLWQRVRDALRSGTPKTIGELAELLDAKVDTVEKTVKRKTELFTRVKSDDGIQRFALLERRAS